MFRSSKEAPISSRLGSLLNTDTAELAQQVMTLTLQMEESAAVSRALEERYKQSVELLKQQKEENDDANKRQQKFIDQVRLAELAVLDWGAHDTTLRFVLIFF